MIWLMAGAGLVGIAAVTWFEVWSRKHAEHAEPIKVVRRGH